AFINQACANSQEEGGASDTKEKEKIRYFLGGKIGYSGMHINSIENLTIGKDRNKYSTFVSTMPVGAFIGFQYEILPSFGLRAEIEYLYRLEVDSRKRNGYRYLEGSISNGQLSTTEKDGLANTTLSLEAHTVLANLWLDYYITPRISVYGGVGIGVAIVETSIDAPSYSLIDDIPEPEAEKVNINFAWKVGVGSRFLLTNHIALDLNASYVSLALPNTTLGGGQLLRMKHGMVGAVEVLAGISYIF
ncbi:MAG: porin family protein, partial [Desulfovibrionaceae bacterium]|nr:porin family protein [Desulfovibrionaceae bacterium]